VLISKKKWFSGVALAGGLLSTSLIGVAPSQAAILDSQVAPKNTTMQTTILKNHTFVVSNSSVYSQMMREALNRTPTIEVKTNVAQLSETAKVGVEEKKTALAGETSQASQIAEKPSAPPQKVAYVKPKQASAPPRYRGVVQRRTRS